MNIIPRSLRGLGRRPSQASRSGPAGALQARRNALRPRFESLEERLTLTGSVTITDAFLVDGSGNPLAKNAVISADEQILVKADVIDQGLPSYASYRIAYTLDGHTQYSPSFTPGGSQGNSWYIGVWTAALGANQVTVAIDPDPTSPATSYTSNSDIVSFTAGPASPGDSLSYTVAQIRGAYGINGIPEINSKTSADGTGETIAIVDGYNDPSIISDLDDFDRAMTLSTGSSTTLYSDPRYGKASNFFNVFNQVGTNITGQIANSGEGGVPVIDPPGTSIQGEESMDVQWAHAIAPGAKIDLIETDGTVSGFFAGVAIAASRPDVTVVSMSFGIPEYGEDPDFELTQDQQKTYAKIFTAYPGVTFLGASGDGGDPGVFPSVSPDVVAVGGTQLTLDGNSYTPTSETAWSLPAPTSTLEDGSSSYKQVDFTSHPGGFSGTYSTAVGGSYATATWTTRITTSDEGWDGGTAVSVTWPVKPTNSEKVTYEIYDGTAATGQLLGKAVVDQNNAPVGTTVDGVQFQELGDYYLNTGDTLTVVLSAKDSTGGVVVADAIGVAAAWATGGGESEFETEPSYQLPYQSTGSRTTPDVSLDGSINTGVTVVQGGYYQFGYFGTSLSTPCWAGLVAIADQVRMADGGTPLNSAGDPSQTLEALYSLPPGDFNDITTGYNGTSTPTGKDGYNEDTGRGTPIANLLIPDLASYGIPNHVVISPSAASVVAGGAVGLTVDVEDRLGNLAATYDGSVTLELVYGPNGASTPVTMDAVDGVATFPSVTLTAAGEYIYEAYSPGLIAAATAVFATPGPAYQLVTTSEPASPVVAGTTFGLTVKAEDFYGNVATSFDGSVTVAEALGTPGVLKPVTVTAKNGVATFSSLSMTTAGFYILYSASGNLVYGSAYVTVIPAAASQVAITSLPSSVAAGSPFGATAKVEDEYGNVVTSYDGSVTLGVAFSPSGAFNPVTVTAVNGVASFSNLSLTSATTYLFYATSGSLADGLAFLIVTPGPAYQLVVISQPSSVIDGETFGLIVTAEDRYGNVATSFDGSVTMTFPNSPYDTYLGGMLTVTAVNGVATFTDLYLIVGLFYLGDSFDLTATSGNLISGKSKAIEVD